MALGFALKVVLSVITGTAVVAPVSYLVANGTFSSSSSFTFEDGESCRHLPLKPHENDKKLLVCITKGGTKPVFKWWTKEGTETGKVEEISTLSWKEKTESVTTTKVFEMQIQLKGKEGLIKEEGQDNFYLPYKKIDQLEESCSLEIGGAGGKFTFTCNVTADLGERKSHVIDTFDVVHSR